MDSYTLRFVPLGGIVGVTKNMYLYELYRDGQLADILIVDCGIGFTREKELGIDYIIPDISYLKDKTDKIRALLLTHGHDDHISAVKIHYEALGKPKIYASKLTGLFTKSKCAEFGVRPDITEIQYRKDYVIGNFTVRFIHLTHSIPDTTHILIKTPAGIFYHGSDFKMDLTPPHSLPPDFYEITRAGEEGILGLFSDCLGSEREGFTLSESAIFKTFEAEMRVTRGKFIMTTFSSNISRIRQCMEAAVMFNRKICFLGRSMKENYEIAAKIGYLPVAKKFMIDEKALLNLPGKSLCIIAAGSQGQYDSALSKIAQGSSRYLKIEPGDKVVFSSDPIPGQEEDVNETIEQLYALGAVVVYPSITERLHASGHGNRGDLKLLIRMTKPKYLIPIGGTIRHQRRYLELSSHLGYAADKVLLMNEGQTVIFNRGQVEHGNSVETRNVFVDAYGIGDVGSLILRDRKALSTDGFVLVVLFVDKNGNNVRPPELISRGFILKGDEEKMFVKAKDKISPLLNVKVESTVFEPSQASRKIIHALEAYFSQATGRKPLIIVEVVPV